MSNGRAKDRYKRDMTSSVNASFDALNYFNVCVPPVGGKQMENHTGSSGKHTQSRPWRIWRITAPPPPSTQSPVEDPHQQQHKMPSHGHHPSSFKRHDSVSGLRHSSGDPNLIRIAEFDRVSDPNWCAKERPQDNRMPPWDAEFTREYLNQDRPKHRRQGKSRKPLHKRSKSAMAARRDGAMVSSYTDDFRPLNQRKGTYSNFNRQQTRSNDTHGHNYEQTDQEEEMAESNHNPTYWQPKDAVNEDVDLRKYPLYAMDPAGDESDVEPLYIDQLEALDTYDPSADNLYHVSAPGQNPLQKEIEQQSRVAKQRFLHHFYSNSVASLLGVGQQFLSKTYPIKVTERQKMKCKQGSLALNGYGSATRNGSKSNRRFDTDQGSWVSVYERPFKAESETRSSFSDPWRLALTQWNNLHRPPREDQKVFRDSVESNRVPHRDRRSIERKTELREDIPPQAPNPYLANTESIASSTSSQEVTHNDNYEKIPEGRFKGYITNSQYSPSDRYTQHLNTIKNAPERLSLCEKRHQELNAKRTFLRWNDTELKKRNQMDKQRKKKLDQYASNRSSGNQRRSATPQRSANNISTYREALANALRNQLPSDYF